MSAIEYAVLDGKLQIELGDLSGNIWDAATRKLKLNEAIGWFSRIFPYEVERQSTVVLGERSYQAALPQPDETLQPPWRILGVLLAGQRVTMQPDPDDSDPNSMISDALINRTLTWRLRSPDTVVFSQGLGTGSGINGPAIVGQTLTVIAWFAWYDFDMQDTLALDTAYSQLLLLKAAELCHLWAAPLAARLGRDTGSEKAAATYATRIAEVVAALKPSPPAQSRPLRK